jgi:N6-L-threonylcarbamoyladenine synthase
VTAGPGLIGGVLSGVMTAKGLAMGLGKPLIGVNHLAGHALTPRLTDGARFPYLLLLVSGGHCQILRVDDWNEFTRLGGTIDDAPGEAFDKVARLLGLPQPGGPVGRGGGAQGRSRSVRLPPPAAGPDGFDMSFSGLKTAVLRARDRLIADQGGLTEGDRADICAGFQAAVADVLAAKTGLALEAQPDVTALAVAGGVAANATLRVRLDAVAGQAKLPLLAPPLALCTDNAAMIAYAGLLSYEAGVVSDHDACRAAALAARHDGGPACRVGTQGGQGMTRLAVYGAGAFGSALAMTYAAAGLQVTLWARAGADRIAETRETPRLPGVRCPTAIRVTQTRKIDADIALIAVPTQSMDAMFRPFIPARRSSSPAPRASTWRPASVPRH